MKISKVLESIATKHKHEITSVALAYVMKKTPYVFPIVGGRKISHLKGNIAGLSLELSDEDVKQIEEANAFDIGVSETRSEDFTSALLHGRQNMESSFDVYLKYTLQVSHLSVHHESASRVYLAAFREPILTSKQFPMSFLGGPTGVNDPSDVWLMAMAGKQQHVAAPKALSPMKM